MTKIAFLERYFSLKFLMLVAYIFATISLFVYAKKNYNDFMVKKRAALDLASHKIAFDLVNSFDEIEINFAKIGQKIISSDESKEAIAKLLIDAELAQLDESVEKQLSLGKFYWIDNQDRLSINSNGIIENAITLSQRDYLENTSQIFGRIFGGSPIIGAVSGQYIIPLGFGVGGKKYLGSLAVGVRLSELTARFASLVDDEKINFALFDQQNNLLLSFDEKIFLEDKKFISQIANANNPSQVYFDGDKNIYFVMENIKKYPYKIVTSYQDKILFAELALQMLPLIIQFLFMTAFFVMIRFRLRISQ